MSAHAHKHDVTFDGPIADIHCTQRGDTLRVGVTLEVSPEQFEGVLTGLGMDASGSLEKEYGRGGLWWSRKDNLVDQSMGLLVPFLAKMDADEDIWVAYWAAGNGFAVVPVHNNEITAEDAAKMTFAGPENLGSQTMVFPLLFEFIKHVKSRMSSGENVQQAILVVITDGAFHDYLKVLAFTQELAAAIKAGTLPQIIFSVAGVGNAVQENQLQNLMHDTFEGEEHEIWCYNLLKEMKPTNLFRLVAHLVTSKIVAFTGGAYITDNHGEELIRFESNVPGHFEFDMEHDASTFTLHIDGQEYTNSVEDLEHEGEDEHHDDDDDHEPAGHGGHGGHH